MKTFARALAALALAAAFAGVGVGHALDQDAPLACADFESGLPSFDPATNTVTAAVHLFGTSCQGLPYNMQVFNRKGEGFPVQYQTVQGDGSSDFVLFELTLDAPDPDGVVCVTVTSGPYQRVPIGTGAMDIGFALDRGPDEGCIVAPLPPCPPPGECSVRGFN